MIVVKRGDLKICVQYNHFLYEELYIGENATGTFPTKFGFKKKLIEN